MFDASWQSPLLPVSLLLDTPMFFIFKAYVASFTSSHIQKTWPLQLADIQTRPRLDAHAVEVWSAYVASFSHSRPWASVLPTLVLHKHLRQGWKYLWYIPFTQLVCSSVRASSAGLTSASRVTRSSCFLEEEPFICWSAKGKKSYLLWNLQTQAFLSNSKNNS